MGKHFISVLGIGKYNAVYYGEDEEPTCFIQEAILRQKVGSLEPDDRISIFVTEESLKKNYEPADDRAGLKNTLIRNLGVREEQLQAVIIPVGKNEAELQEIFNRMYDEIRDGEHLFVDITHSLRNIPVQALAALTFARVVKNITIEGVYYGAFEVRDVAAERAPIFELTSFLDIIDWAHAANSFKRYGSSEELRDLSKEYNIRMHKGVHSKEQIKEAELLNSLSSALVKITRSIATARGCYDKDRNAGEDYSVMQAYKGYVRKRDHYLEFANAREDKTASPLNKLVSVIDQKARPFDKRCNLEIGIETVKWSIENNMTQQGFTALEETIKTYLCNRYELDETQRCDREQICKGVCNCLNEVNIGNQEEREAREKAFEKWKRRFEGVGQEDRTEVALTVTEKKIAIAERMVNELSPEFIHLCANLSSSRNSLNHFGFAQIGEYSWKKLDETLKKYFDEFMGFYNNHAV